MFKIILYMVIVYSILAVIANLLIIFCFYLFRIFKIERKKGVTTEWKMCGIFAMIATLLSLIIPLLDKG